MCNIYIIDNHIILISQLLPITEYFDNIYCMDSANYINNGLKIFQLYSFPSGCNTKNRKCFGMRAGSSTTIIFSLVSFRLNQSLVLKMKMLCYLFILSFIFLFTM